MNGRVPHALHLFVQQRDAFTQVDAAVHQGRNGSGHAQRMRALEDVAAKRHPRGSSLERVVNETAPTNVADWTARDRPRARTRLDELRDRK